MTNVFGETNRESLYTNVEVSVGSFQHIRKKVQLVLGSAAIQEIRLERAEGSIELRVVDKESNEPIVDALVRLNDLVIVKRMATPWTTLVTDENGSARLEGVNATTFNLHVGADGYESYKEQVHLKRDEKSKQLVIELRKAKPLEVLLFDASRAQEIDNPAQDWEGAGIYIFQANRNWDAEAKHGGAKYLPLSGPRATLPPLANGHYTLMTFVHGYELGFFTFEVKSGEITPLTLAMNPTKELPSIPAQLENIEVLESAMALWKSGALSAIPSRPLFGCDVLVKGFVPLPQVTFLRSQMDISMRNSTRGEGVSYRPAIPILPIRWNGSIAEVTVKGEGAYTLITRFGQVAFLTIDREGKCVLDSQNVLSTGEIELTIPVASYSFSDEASLVLRLAPVSDSPGSKRVYNALESLW
ncbi:MAG: carboxypeptidase regulatory-like domain-containing protein, partial [Planctomycetes bacterium]|nr:carboxypeptidase regulatory-like domain-containing protein [Planctomycetota bacterium]